MSGDLAVKRDISFSDGGLSMSATLQSTLKAAVDYDYRKNDGGLRLARLDVVSESSIEASQVIAQGAAARYEREIGRVRIPINVTVVDAALRALGVRVVSIQVPFVVGVSLTSDFRVELSESLATTGRISVRYDPTSGPTTDTSIAASVAFNKANPTTPGGLPVFGSAKEVGSLYLRMAPALAFLDRVAMLGADATLSALGAAELQVVPDAPPYCLSIYPAVELSAYGFFKAVGIAPLKTDAFGTSLYSGSTRYFGSCRAPVSMQAIVQTPQPVSAGVPISVQAQVIPTRTNNATQLPSGTIRIQSGEESCEAKLGAASNGSATATCALTPRKSGAAVPLTVAYSGDAVYAPVGTSTTVAIRSVAAATLVCSASAGLSEPWGTSGAGAVVMRGLLWVFGCIRRSGAAEF